MNYLPDSVTSSTGTQGFRYTQDAICARRSSYADVVLSRVDVERKLGGSRCKARTLVLRLLRGRGNLSVLAPNFERRQAVSRTAHSFLRDFMLLDPIFARHSLCVSPF
jgi:hypothetical protein